MNELSQYIDKQREAGTVESAGSFTLAIEKARDKLGTYSLPNQQDYVLKVVQCAVVLGVEKLSVSLTRDTVLFYFEVPLSDDTLSVDNLTRSLVSPLEEKHQGRAHLAIALCSIVAQEPTELMWGDWGGDDHSVILSLGHGRSELFRDAPFPRTEALSSDRRLHLLFVKKPPSRLPLSQTALEQEVLGKRCGFAPIPIDVNGSELKARLPVYISQGDPIRELTSLYFAAFRIQLDEQKTLRWSPAERGLVSNLRKKLPPELGELAPGLPPVFKTEDSNRSVQDIATEGFFSKLYVVPGYLLGPSRLHYVKHGVLLSPVETHDAGGGAFAILDGNHLKTDLTGLRPIEDERIEEDTRKAIAVWKQQVDDFVNGKPPVYQSSRFSSLDDIFHQIFGVLFQGPAGKVLTPIYDYLSRREHNLNMQTKKFRRLLQTRLNYSIYSKKKTRD